MCASAGSPPISSTGADGGLSDCFHWLVSGAQGGSVKGITGEPRSYPMINEPSYPIEMSRGMSRCGVDDV
jgi:hypothetical protein